MTDGRSPRATLAPERMTEPHSGAGSHWLLWLIGIGLLAIVVLAVAFELHRSHAGQSETANPNANPQGPSNGTGAGGARDGARDGARSGGNQPTPVLVSTARKGNMDRLLVGLGAVTPLNTATIRSRVDGQIMKVDFTEGQLVKQGDPLFEIDPRPYQVMVDQAQGQMVKDQAALKNAKANVQRDTDAKDAIAAQQLDTDTATQLQDEGAVKIDQAQIDNGKLQVDYSHITAPFAGRIGLRLVDVGNIVHAADTTGLAVIAQEQPISVIFSLPEDDIPRVLASMKKTKDLKVIAYARDLRTLLATGKLLTIDNEVDPTSGTFRLKAEFANEDSTLFPSQFVSARLLAETLQGTTIVSAAAVQQGPDFSYVYVVDPEKKTVALRKVTVATVAGNELLIASPRPANGGDELSVQSGINPGDVVVVDGIDKLHDGAAVSYGEKGGRGGNRSESTTQSTANTAVPDTAVPVTAGEPSTESSTGGGEEHHRGQGAHRSHDQLTSAPSS